MIHTISEISPFATEARSSVDIGKEYTTVGIDYGRLSLAEDVALGLYGLPGQKRFSMLWDMVAQGLWGLLVLVKYSEDFELDDLQTVLAHFAPHESKVPVAVGISHCENTDCDDLDTFIENIQMVLLSYDLSSPVYPVDPRDVDSSIMMLQLFDAMNSVPTTDWMESDAG